MRKIITNQEMLDDIQAVAQSLDACYLAYANYRKNGGKYGEATFSRRFGSWNKAIIACGLTPMDGAFPRVPRKVNLFMRYKILKRDAFKCVLCGQTPARNPKIELHVDHIIPFSKGGKCEMENLQTLCSMCNLGKSDFLFQ